jgi:hypothetical protein
MNTTQNKAALWKSCVEQGIFDKVPSGMQPQVQGLFELTINRFNHDGMEPALANQLVLKEFKLQLGKMIGQPMPQKTFEEMNEEYKSQYQAKVPEKIEFSQEKDSPLENMDQILKTMAEKRQNEIHEFFKDEKDLGSLPMGAEVLPSTEIKPTSSSLANSPLSNSSIPNVMSLSNSAQTELQLHRRILESILTSQIKIIELLQRK